MPRVPAVLQFDFGMAAPHFAARTIAMIPALIGSGRQGQESMSAASSGASFGAWVSTAPDSAPPGSGNADFSGEFEGGSIPIHSRSPSIRAVSVGSRGLPHHLALRLLPCESPLAPTAWTGPRTLLGWLRIIITVPHLFSTAVSMNRFIPPAWRASGEGPWARVDSGTRCGLGEFRESPLSEGLVAFTQASGPPRFRQGSRPHYHLG